MHLPVVRATYQGGGAPSGTPADSPSEEPVSQRRLLVATLLSTTVAAVASPALSAPPAGGGVDVVLSVASSFSSEALPPGSRLLDSYPGVGAVLVRVQADGVHRVASTPGVRGVSPDRALSLTGHAGGSTGVLAPKALGAPAGTPGAGSGVTVALVDSGVADTPVLRRSSGRLVSGPDTTGEGAGARDGYGHGTFMAGLIAGGAVAGQQVGVAPAARVVDVKVAGADGSTSLSKVLDGLDWVVRNKEAQRIGVLSLSLAAARPAQGYGRDPLTDATEAVRRAGVVVVVSAGNEPGQVGDPGQDPLLMTVGAADTVPGAAPATASFSGSGVVAGMPRPDVVAPGVSMLSVLPEGSLLARTNPGSAAGKGLSRGSGTSQATAVAAGAVSVFLSQHAQDAPTPDDVRASFATAAQDLPGTADGAGLIRWPGSVVRWSAEQSGNAAPSADGSADGWSGSWSASSWSASSWSASSWSASSWSASSWSASSWSASSWSASSWSASSWSWREEPR